MDEGRSVHDKECQTSWEIELLKDTKLSYRQKSPMWCNCPAALKSLNCAPKQVFDVDDLLEDESDRLEKHSNLPSGDSAKKEQKLTLHTNGRNIDFGEILKNMHNKSKNNAEDCGPMYYGPEDIPPRVHLNARRVDDESLSTCSESDSD